MHYKSILTTKDVFYLLINIYLIIISFNFCIGYSNFLAILHKKKAII